MRRGKECIYFTFARLSERNAFSDDLSSISISRLPVITTLSLFEKLTLSVNGIRHGKDEEPDSRVSHLSP